jgi:acetoacetyl-CoA synthetase
MCSALPVYRGEIQCRMLGMAIEAFAPLLNPNPPNPLDSSGGGGGVGGGEPVKPGESGELVCTRPFPCQPLGFWPIKGFSKDEGAIKAAEARHQASYFGEYPGIWCRCPLLSLSHIPNTLSLNTLGIRLCRPDTNLLWA